MVGMLVTIAKHHHTAPNYVGCCPFTPCQDGYACMFDTANAIYLCCSTGSSFLPPTQFPTTFPTQFPPTPSVDGRLSVWHNNKSRLK